MAPRLENVPSFHGRRPSAQPRTSRQKDFMSWLLDTDVLCQPAKANGDPSVIAWLEEHEDECYTCTIVLGQIAYWIRTKKAGRVFGYRTGSKRASMRLKDGFSFQYGSSACLG
jgi:hypothetical protein